MAGTGLSSDPSNSFPSPASTTFYRTPALDSNPQRALTPMTATQYYPAHPEQLKMNISMLHPVAYMPPSGPYLNAHNLATELGGDKYCRTCLEPIAFHDPPLEGHTAAFPCTQGCGLQRPFVSFGVAHPVHTGQPCPQIYISMQLAKRRWHYNSNRIGWYAASQCYPSENEWTILQTNGYIEQDSVYNNAQQPAFTAKAWSLRSADTHVCKPIQGYKHQPTSIAPDMASDTQGPRTSATIPGFPATGGNGKSKNANARSRNKTTAAPNSYGFPPAPNSYGFPPNNYGFSSAPNNAGYSPAPDDGRFSPIVHDGLPAAPNDYGFPPASYPASESTPVPATTGFAPTLASHAPIEPTGRLPPMQPPMQPPQFKIEGAATLQQSETLPIPGYSSGLGTEGMQTSSASVTLDARAQAETRPPAPPRPTRFAQPTPDAQTQADVRPPAPLRPARSTDLGVSSALAYMPATANWIGIENQASEVALERVEEEQGQEEEEETYSPSEWSRQEHSGVQSGCPYGDVLSCSHLGNL